jgi:ribosomal protein S18 acetylase RimI-like enzyme
MAAITRSVQSASPHLRPFDVRRDLNAVADLVELCFAETLDSDGRHYIQQMRSAARSPSYLLWAAAAAERVPLPLSGYVWEENGYLAGNLSLIPFNTAGRRIYLIANVAVDPAYRRRGIARSLTTTAMQHVKKKGTDSVWLHVRADNSDAFNLYSSLGFEERTRRTTWESSRAYPQQAATSDWPDSTGISIVRRHARFWSKQRQWLKRVYPPEIAWHMNFNLKTLRPGLWGAIQRLLTGTQIRQLAAAQRRRLIGVLAWQPLNYRSDQLWLAADPENEVTAIRVLLSHLQRKLPYRRDLAIEYPAEQSTQAFKDAGFEIRQTLVWMEKVLRD